jgi:hypothetical protein
MKEIRKEKLARRHERAIAALLAVPTLTEAARDCGISARTMRRWLRNKEFSTRYDHARAAALENVVSLLKEESAGAVAVLAAVARDQQSPAGARVTAAGKLLDLHLRSSETAALEKRVEQLEDALRNGRRP